VRITTLATACLLVAGVTAPAPAAVADQTTTWTGTMKTVDGPSQTVSVSVPVDRDVATGEAAAVDVQLSTPDQAVVDLEQRDAAGTWQVVDSEAAEPGDSSFSFGVDTGTPGVVTVRVVVEPSDNFDQQASPVFDFTVSAPAPAKKPSSITLTAPAARATTVGARRLAVTGRVNGGSARTVRLELRTPRGWMGLATDVTDGSGRYAIRVPTDWYYSGVLRTRVVATDRYDAASSATFPMRVRPDYRPGGHANQHSFTSRARWNPCQAISYKVNRVGGPRRSLSQIKHALRLVHRATGLRFVYKGSTNAVAYRTDGKGPSRSDADLTIGFGTVRQVAGLRGSVVGLGGTAWSGGQIVAGVVVMERGARLKPGFGSGPTWGTLMLHEIGHAMGLGHVGQPREVMYPAINRQSRGRYQAGDLAGLRRLGATGGCLDGGSALADRLGPVTRVVSR
jgi:hypothetical protein